MNELKLNYVLKNFNLLYEIPEEFLQSISFGNIEPNTVHVTSSNNLMFVQNPITDIWKETKIPFLNNDTKVEEIISTLNNKVIINYDILSPIFYLLSGQQEIESTTKDTYGRFQYKDSLQHKFNFAEIPVVNYYFDILKTAFELAYDIKIESKHDFTACLTHDIDEVDSAWKHRIRIELEKKKFFKAGMNFFKHLNKPFFPWRNLKEIMSLETEKKVISTFFILTNNNKIDEIKNADYKLTSNYMKKQLHDMTINGFEIGVHGSYKTHTESTKLTKDIALLPKEIKGNRFHFLQWDMKKSPLVIEKNKLKYDTSLGFQEQIGFRNGICNPFYLFNFETEKAYGFLEIPLTVMDCSLAFQDYMDLTPIESVEKLNSIINEVKKFRGILTLNWHNTFMSDYVNLEWKKVYIQLIDTLKKVDSSFNTCSEIAKKYSN